MQIPVRTIQDTSNESDETVILEISANGDTYVIDNAGVGIIIDDDDSLQSLQVLDSFGMEGVVDIVFTVLLDEPAASPA